MSRRRTLPQDCIICGEVCECNKKPERPKRTRVPKAEQPAPVPEPDEPIVVAPKPSAVDAMRRAAQSAELDRRKTEPLQVKSKTSLSDDEALMVDAVRLLDEKLGPVEGPDAEKYRPYLNRSATPGERAAAWRARRSVQ